jgi:hypothetical protein
MGRQTDDLVYDITRRQLDELCREEQHVRLHLYQTGLENRRINSVGPEATDLDHTCG